MKSHRLAFINLPFFLVACLAILSPTSSRAQNKQIVRMAKIKIDSAQLDQYKAALKDGIEIALRTEPGVLMLYAVYEKGKPTCVTVMEIYADEEAYQFHIQTPHFKKYKETTRAMVKSLQLMDVFPIAGYMKETKIAR